MASRGYLYAFKYRDMRCTIDGVPCVFVKFGKVTKGWPNLMSRFANHQTATMGTFGFWPRLPKHGQKALGEVPLYTKSCGREEDTVSVSDVDDVIHAMKNDYIAGLYKAEYQAEERSVWPDLAYIVPMDETMATIYEGVMPWNLATYLDQGHLKAQLDTLHALRHPTATSNVSNTESFLIPESTFDSLRQLFLAGSLDTNTITQLTLGARAGLCPEKGDATITWTNAANNRRTMPVRYVMPFHSPEAEGALDTLGLLVTARRG